MERLDYLPVGPRPFVRSFALITQRFVAICLLVLYGVPAIVGPHWHHHGHACSDCNHSAADHLSGCSSTAGQDCCHSHGSPQEPSDCKPSEQSGSSTDAVALAVMQGHAACSICAFYAQAQTPLAVNLILCSGQLIALTSALSIRWVSTLGIAAQARGPPGCI
jgi:hypothetical protein